MLKIKSFFKLICPCIFDFFDDEVPLIADTTVNNENENNHSINQSQTVEGQNSRRSLRRRLNNSRYRKNDFKRDEETERALKEILDRTKERMIDINEFNERMNYEKLQSMMDNENYLRDINAHDKLSKDVIKQDCLLEPTADDEELVNLLTQASSLPLETSENINKLLNNFNATLKKVSTVEFDEPLVVYMNL